MPLYRVQETFANNEAPNKNRYTIRAFNRHRFYNSLFGGGFLLSNIFFYIYSDMRYLPWPVTITASFCTLFSQFFSKAATLVNPYTYRDWSPAQQRLQKVIHNELKVAAITYHKKNIVVYLPTHLLNSQTPKEYRDVIRSCHHINGEALKKNQLIWLILTDEPGLESGYTVYKTPLPAENTVLVSIDSIPSTPFPSSYHITTHSGRGLYRSHYHPERWACSFSGLQAASTDAIHALEDFLTNLLAIPACFFIYIAQFFFTLLTINQSLALGVGHMPSQTCTWNVASLPLFTLTLGLCKAIINIRLKNDDAWYHGIMIARRLRHCHMPTLPPRFCIDAIVTFFLYALFTYYQMSSALFFAGGGIDAIRAQISCANPALFATPTTQAILHDTKAIIGWTGIASIFLLCTLTFSFSTYDLISSIGKSSPVPIGNTALYGIFMCTTLVDGLLQNGLSAAFSYKGALFDHHHSQDFLFPSERAYPLFGLITKPMLPWVIGMLGFGLVNALFGLRKGTKKLQAAYRFQQEGAAMIAATPATTYGSASPDDQDDAHSMGSHTSELVRIFRKPTDGLLGPTERERALRPLNTRASAQ